MSNAGIGVVVVGAGRIGTVHAGNLRGSVPGAYLAAVVDPDDERAQRVSWGQPTFPDLEQALELQGAGAVVIASPTDRHPEQIALAAAAGIPVFCEKPVAPDLESTVAALTHITSRGVPFQIGFNRRFDPAFARLGELVRQGELGRLEMFRSLSCDPEPAPLEYLRRSGGIYLDQAIHDIDLARFLGGEIREASALGARMVVPDLEELGDVDTSILTLRFESGALGVIQSSRRAVYGHDVRVEVMGSKGKAIGELERSTSVWVYGDDGIRGDYAGSFIERFREAYLREITAFVSSVARGVPPSPGPRDAVESLRVAVAATRSLASGQPVAISSVAASLEESRRRCGLGSEPTP